MAASLGSMSRHFDVMVVKRMTNQQNFVNISFPTGMVVFTKTNSRGEKRKEFSCSSFLKMVKDSRRTSSGLSDVYLHVHIDTELDTQRKKTLLFQSSQEREMFNNIMSSMYLCGSEAYELWCQLVTDHSNFLSKAVIEQKLRERTGDDSVSIPLAMNNAQDDASIEFVEFLFIYAKTLIKREGFSLSTPAPPEVKKRNSAAANRRFAKAGLHAHKMTILTMFLGNNSLNEACQVMLNGLLSGEGTVGIQKVALLQGEKSLFKINNNFVTCIEGDTKKQVKCSLELTNYRIIYKPLRQEPLSITLASINRLKVGQEHTARESSMTIHVKDHRKLKLFFNGDASIVGQFAQFASAGSDDSAAEFIHKIVEVLAFPGDEMKLFASSHVLRLRSPEEDGWNFYDPLAEYARMGFEFEDSTSPFRLCSLNIDYKVSPTYPSLFVTPAAISDHDIEQVCQYRSRARLPGVVYLYDKGGTTLSRCAQPLAGVSGKRCRADEKLLTAIREANQVNSKILYIVDFRPFKAAVGNKLMGKGSENTNNYKNTQVIFLDIENIHAMRNSLTKLMDLCSNESSVEDISGWGQKVEETRWLEHQSIVLSGVMRMVNIFRDEGASIVCHCSDGWDRTSQACSLVELLVDPFYRTLKGFGILIEREWLSFGHKFSERYGHGDPHFNNSQRSPIFLQWLDSVYQIQQQFPLAFEFNEEFLLTLAEHLYSCRFGTFLFETECERKAKMLARKTVSIWSYLCNEENHILFRNPCYKPYEYQHLNPNVHVSALKIWRNQYMRYSPYAGAQPHTDRLEHGASELYDQLLHTQRELAAFKRAAAEAGIDIKSIEKKLKEEDELEQSKCKNCFKIECSGNCEYKRKMRQSYTNIRTPYSQGTKAPGPPPLPSNSLSSSSSSSSSSSPTPNSPPPPPPSNATAPSTSSTSSYATVTPGATSQPPAPPPVGHEEDVDTSDEEYEYYGRQRRQSSISIAQRSSLGNARFGLSPAPFTDLQEVDETTFEQPSGASEYVPHNPLMDPDMRAFTSVATVSRSPPPPPVPETDYDGEL